MPEGTCHPRAETTTIPAPSLCAGLPFHMRRERVTNGVSLSPHGLHCSTSARSGKPVLTGRKQQAGMS